MLSTLFRSKWQLLYAFILLLDVIFTGLDMHSARYVTKPLLTILLIIFVLSNAGNMKSSYLRFLLLALIFSFGGDVLLMFDSHFLTGLGSFLLAHVFYILFFLKIRYSNPPVPMCKYPVIFLHAAFLIGFILLLLPHLGALKIPVIIYALALSITVQSSIHAFNLKWQPAGWFCIIGAVLFLISDSLIALGKFYQPLPANGVLVMITYGLAQWGITAGAVSYFNPLSR
ncbi:putative membrane protein YhhN [Chitinophaga dinghuensis]|uniref:Putative membrane protein YhhN n=1 Tax=Chitinophaga dinghuensis TaxID=1539050 RepID=A0A327W8I2_9BACT|nr:lysoplasmalogenase [Chitinophaga dinghuensis]RAJ85693.1 putative membrane protein YhhN [Chitinophaga dinghuensis]